MKNVVIAVGFSVLISGNCLADTKYIEMSTNPQEVVSGQAVQFECAVQ